jgi:hypothetical protein
MSAPVELPSHHFYTLDLGALATMWASIEGLFPHALVLLPAIYYGIMVWESETVRNWTGRKRKRRH